MDVDSTKHEERTASRQKLKSIYHPLPIGKHTARMLGSARFTVPAQVYRVAMLHLSVRLLFLLFGFLRYTRV